MVEIGDSVIIQGIQRLAKIKAIEKEFNGKEAMILCEYFIGVELRKTVVWLPLHAVEILPRR